MNRNKIYSIVLLLVLLLGAATAAFAQTSANGVSPTTYNVGMGGNLTCDDVGDYEFSSGRINYDENTGLFDAPFPAGISVSTDGTYVSWSSTFGIGAVIVKGGDAANAYVYNPQATSDSDLAAPVNASGGPAGLSNITFCWNPEPPENGEWCSPGYWRQPHHYDSWVATGISPDAKYNSYFDPDLPGNPSLLYVLQNPGKFQRYRLDSINRIGDLLSDAHPDVNFVGERVEDSCPLN